ncbi:hypothetical protein ARMGADRAFT_1030837 [Armillaria gallica]|uniref:Uncharacterized protein n=1 Tax=Armillaria gallica TaxID=47427 RepID=A0A2H3DFJ2_ARMGA|nr:hypothetical protein ARMGADRAFT_1030837 [Armillaria gallica]
MPGLSNADIAEMLSNLGSEMDRVILASLLQDLAMLADLGMTLANSSPSPCSLSHCHCRYALKIYTTCQPYSMVQSYFKYLVLYVLTVVRGAPVQGKGVYWHFLEVFMESLAFTFYYLDPIAGITWGIALTLLVGHITAGHACLDDSWKGSVMTSPLHFGMTRLRRAFWDILWQLMRTSKLSPGGEVAIPMYMSVDRLALIKEDTVGESLDVGHLLCGCILHGQLEGYMAEVDMMKNWTGKDCDIFIYKLT